jgi:hypothetical protein
MLAAAMFIRFARSPARIAPWRSRVARPGGGDALSRRRLLQRVREPVDRGAQSPGELGDPGLAQDIAGEHARRFVRKPADSTATGTKAFSTGSTSAVSIRGVDLSVDVDVLPAAQRRGQRRDHTGRDRVSEGHLEPVGQQPGDQ